MIVLPAMPPEQTASWIGVLELYDRLNEGWTLIGGQLVHLHCAERGQFPVRPRNDVETVIDVRAPPRTVAVTVDRREGFVRRPTSSANSSSRQPLTATRVTWTRAVTAATSWCLPDWSGRGTSETTS
jgi:hypothetical protein